MYWGNKKTNKINRKKKNRKCNIKITTKKQLTIERLKCTLKSLELSGGKKKADIVIRLRKSGQGKNTELRSSCLRMGSYHFKEDIATTECLWCLW